MTTCATCALIRGPHVFARLGVPEDRQVPEDRRNEVASAIRGHLAG